MHIKSHLAEVDLAQLCAAAGLGEASAVVEELDARGAVVARAAHAPEAPIYPASMIKLPIAMALSLACNAGDHRFDERVVVAEANITTNDAPSPFVAGYVARLDELAHAMLAASDNVATNVLIDVVGRERLTTLGHALGLKGTVVARKLSGSLPLIDDPLASGRNAHPVADFATLLRRLASAETAEFAILARALGDQIWNDKLSRGLAPGDAFAHKTGDTDDVSHDGGLLTRADGVRFVVVVYTALPSNPDTDARFATFARALRPYLDATVQDRSVDAR